MKAGALIGLGMVANTHLAAFQASSDVRLTGVLGRDQAAAEKVAHKAARSMGHPVRKYASAAEIAHDPEVDFVILATPPNARMEYVDVLSAAGKPLLIEKPIERTHTAAKQIVAMCRTRNVPLGVVLQHRARRASQTLRELVQGGTLGRISTFEVRVPWWRDQSYYNASGRGTYSRDGGGVMITQAIHTLDLALWILGPFAQVQAMLKQTGLHTLEAEDWAAALIRTSSGATGTLMATTSAYPGHAESITVQGTKGAAFLSSGALDVSYLDGTSERTGEPNTSGAGADPMDFTSSWHQFVIEDFACTLDGGIEPLASGHSALMAHAVIDAMERATRSGTCTEVHRI